MTEENQHSQHGEEVVIVKAFGCFVGSFLDIGAYDGLTFSNTARLVELGWSGVMIEPNPSSFTGLMRHHGNNPKLKLINGLIGPDPHIVKFHASPDAVSTTENHNREVWAGAGVPFTETWMKAITIKEFLSQFPGPYHFVNVDTEGTSVDILMALPLDVMETKAVCVEHDGRAVEAAEYLKRFGMETCFLDGTNVIGAKP